MREARPAADTEAWQGDRRVTLNDVAERAQVSRALVSIVMRDAPGASAATRERVRAVARELGYRPDVRARALAGQKSRFIGVIFGTDIGTFQFSMLEALYASAEEHGRSLVLAPVTRGRDERAAAEGLRDFRYDGLILLGPPTALPLLAGTGPLVVVGWHADAPMVDAVRISDTTGMRLGVDHLVARGHRRIAHIDGGDAVIADARRAAYEAAMTAHGLQAHIRCLPGGQTQLDGLRAARVLLDQGDLPTAIVAYNDDSAVGAISWLARHGVDVPRDLSIVGWDDGEAAELSPVGLTTIAQHPERLASSAVQRLVARIEGRRIDDGREVVLEPELVVRASTRLLDSLS